MSSSINYYFLNLQPQKLDCKPSYFYSNKLNSDLIKNLDIDNNSKNNSQSSQSKNEGGGEEVEIIFAPLLLFTLQLYIGLLALYLICNRLPKTPKKLTYYLHVALSNITTLFALPILLPIIISVLIFREFLRVYFKLVYGDKLTLMNGNDAFWANEEYASTSNITVIYMIEGTGKLENVQEKFMNRVMNKVENGKRIYGDKLGQRLNRKCGFFVWEKEENFDIKKHIIFLKEEDPEKNYTENELFDGIATRYDDPLPSEIPKFRIFVAKNVEYKEALPGKKYYAVIYSIHHSYMDGISLGSILKQAETETPIKFALDPVEFKDGTFIEKVLGWMNVFVFGMSSFFTTLSLKEKNCFHPGTKLTGPKKMTWTRPISVNVIRELKNLTKTTTTSVLLSCVGGGIRELALKKGFKVPNRIHSFPTVALLPFPDYTPQNRFTVSLLALNVELETAIQRLKYSFKSAKELAASPDILMSFHTMRLTGVLPSWASKLILDLAHATLLFTNVPGPKDYAVVYGGGKLVDVGCFAPLKSRLGIGVGLFTYGSRLRACIHVDKTACPEPEDIYEIVAGFENEVVALAKSVGISKEEVFNVPPAFFEEVDLNNNSNL